MRFLPFDGLRQHIKDRRFGLNAHGLRLDRAVLEDDQCRDAHDAVAHGKLLLCVHVDLPNLDRGVFLRDLVHNGREHAARTAPRCPKVYQHGLVAVEYLRLKIFFRQFDNCHFLYSFHGLNIDDHQLGGIADAWDTRVIAKTAADYPAVVVNPRGVFGEDSLSGGVSPLTEESPVSAVRVSADGQLNVRFLDIGHKILGMMTEQDTVSVLVCKALEGVGVGSVFAFVDARGQTADAKLADADAIIVKENRPCCGNALLDLLGERDGDGMPPRVALMVAGKLMIPERVVGGGDGDALPQKVVSAVVGVTQIAVIHQVSGDQDQVGLFLSKTPHDLVVRTGVQIRRHGKSQIKGLFGENGVTGGLHSLVVCSFPMLDPKTDQENHGTGDERARKVDQHVRKPCPPVIRQLLM